MPGISPQVTLNFRFTGVFLALGIVCSWLFVEYQLLFAIEWTLSSFFLFAALIPLAMFLFTGMFISAHDAMHQTLAPKDPRLNTLIGALALRLYGNFSFETFRKNHVLHHRAPGTGSDPDFHDGKDVRFLAWYVNFMRHYLTIGQFLATICIPLSLVFLGGVPIPRMLLCWAIPALLSSLQLFYFGTYRVHGAGEALKGPHHAKSNDFGVVWSFFTCYHFGYHLEHHTWPYVPWWKLPGARKQWLEAHASAEVQTVSMSRELVSGRVLENG
jgi:beta-carotene ketolase (CrtW type)